jgi:hypothetical protein
MSRMVQVTRPASGIRLYIPLIRPHIITAWRLISRPISAVRLRPKWTIRLWLASFGIATVAWLAALTRAMIWLVELALS